MALTPLPGQTLHAAIASCEESVEEEKNRLLRTIERVQKDCEHQFVAEAPYNPEVAGRPADGPFRVCMSCGRREEAWTTGYKELQDEEGRIISLETRERASKRIRRFHSR